MARRARFAFLALALFCGMPSHARAWTEAQVTSVAARVEISGDATTHVRLDLKVSVHGGFLMELELAGLDPALELDPSVPVMLTAVPSGEVYTPSVEARADGRVMLRFRSRDSAPKRGQYELALAYTASLVGRGVTVLDSGDVRMSWTLPGWRSGLDAVRIHVVAPRGARPDRPGDVDDRTVTVTRRDLGDRVEIDLERAHLPRTVPWIVNVDLPRASVSASLQSAVTPRGTPKLEPTRAHARSLSPFLVAAIAALLALAKRHAFAAAAARRDAKPKPLLTVRPFVHAALVVSCAGLAGAFSVLSPVASFAGSFALVLLTLERTPSARPRARLGGFRPMTRADQRAALRARLEAMFEPIAVLDPMTPLGGTIALATLTALALLHAHEARDPSDAVFTTWHALVLLACQWLLAGTRLLPSTPAERLRAMIDWARAMRLPASLDASLALRLVVHTDASGQLTDARVRVVSEARAPGLLRLDLAYADKPGLSGHSPCPVWLVVTRAESVADALLDTSLRGHAKSVAPGGRRARVLAYGHASLRALVPLLRAHAPREEADRSRAA